MSKSKRQGTEFETWIHDQLLPDPNIKRVHRLAEQGINDQGDLEVVTCQMDHLYIEARHREVMGIHTALQKHTRKVEENAPTMGTPILIWKRTTQKPGNTKRTTDGIVVVQWFHDWRHTI